ncbi:MAG: proton-conducting membrane transporter, partial [Candidatus Dormibacteraeota bacterium]|nr:proton-conducting membrane transporter [Candidatus Dormibacteraeota bacterium]
LNDALRERGRHRLGGRPPVLVTAPPRYVGGQETAVIARVQGDAAKPSYTPPLPFVHGAWGRPTLVQNVETLARAALIARGQPSAGLALLTVVGAVARTGVVEIAVGASYAEAVNAVGGTVGRPRAVLAGGYFGRWLDVPDGWGYRPGIDVPLGAGVVAVVDSGHCPIAETARIVAYLARESARQCGPCRDGLPALAEGVAGLTGARRPRPRLDLLRRRLEEIAGRGACRHPDGAVVLVQSMLTVFHEQVESHLRTGPCVACAATPLLPIPAAGGGWR